MPQRVLSDASPTSRSFRSPPTACSTPPKLTATPSIDPALPSSRIVEADRTAAAFTVSLPPLESRMSVAWPATPACSEYSSVKT